MRASVLDRGNGELAGLLTGRPGSEPILLDLENASAFVESLDPGRGWFRCRRLLADFLWLELRRTLPSEVPVPHRRAAERHLLAAERTRPTVVAVTVSGGELFLVIRGPG